MAAEFEGASTNSATIRQRSLGLVGQNAHPSPCPAEVLNVEMRARAHVAAATASSGVLITERRPDERACIPHRDVLVILALVLANVAALASDVQVRSLVGIALGVCLVDLVVDLV